MSALNELVYKTISGKAGTSLDDLRNSFYGLFTSFEGANSPIKFTRIGNSYLFHSGFNLSFVNQTAVFDSSPDVLEEALKEVASWNITSSVFLGGPGLAHSATLKDRGFTPDGAVPVMAFAVDQSLKDFQLRPGLRAERTTSHHNFDLNVNMISKTFGMELDVTQGLVRPTIDDPGTFRYILFDGDTPVSSSVFLTKGEFAGCFDVVTPTEHQRKGYGEELMKFMVQEQAELGRKLIVLQASEAGEVLYRRMGFQVVEYLQVWTMEKPVRLSRFEMLDINIGPYRLRQLTADDEELILKNFADEAFQKWMGMPIPFLRENFLNFLTFSQNQYLSGMGIWWVIEENGVPMGQIWIFSQDWYEKKSEIGYLAYPEARGKGMIPFITRELTKKLLFEYKMERVELWTHSENDTSGHVAKKVGFVFEGTHRRIKNYRGEVVAYNQYSMIASDFDTADQ
jgi:RimJ/RimL family protein N-acetyltransferase